MPNVLNSCVYCLMLLAYRGFVLLSPQIRKFRKRLFERFGKALFPIRKQEANDETVDVVDSLSPDDFVRDYLHRNRPVVVRGECLTWAAASTWTHASLAERFGRERVPLQGVDFDKIDNTLLSMRPLSSYHTYMLQHPCVFDVRCGMLFADELPAVALGQMAARFNTDTIPDHTKAGRTVPYLRYQDASGLLQDAQVNFGLYDKADAFTPRLFGMVKGEWLRPSFLPAGGYTLPFTCFSWMFYDWGVYVSPRGACTSLHADGSRTDALLCQVHGSKTGGLFSAAAEDYLLQTSSECHLFSEAPEADVGRLPFQPIPFRLDPGDIVFIPRNWAHEVYTESSSVTLTFNFIWGWREWASW
eukprot:gene2564-3281_t